MAVRSQIARLSHDVQPIQLQLVVSKYVKHTLAREGRTKIHFGEVEHSTIVAVGHASTEHCSGHQGRRAREVAFSEVHSVLPRSVRDRPRSCVGGAGGEALVSQPLLDGVSLGIGEGCTSSVDTNHS